MRQFLLYKVFFVFFVANNLCGVSPHDENGVQETHALQRADLSVQPLVRSPLASKQERAPKRFKVDADAGVQVEDVGFQKPGTHLLDLPNDMLLHILWLAVGVDRAPAPHAAMPPSFNDLFVCRNHMDVRLVCKRFKELFDGQHGPARQAIFKLDNPLTARALYDAWPNLRFLRLSIRHKTFENIAFIARFKALQLFDCSHQPISDISPLKSCPHLRVVTLEGTQVSSPLPLNDHKFLAQVDFSNTKVQSLQDMKGCKSLEVLELMDSHHFGMQGPFTDFQSLAPFSNLKQLTLTYVRGVRFDTLNALHNLEELCLYGANIVDFTPLKLPLLKDLNCAFSNIRCLDPLKNLVSMEVFRCSETGVSSLAPLVHMTNLQRLDAQNTQVRALVPISGCQNLQELYINHTRVDNLQPLYGLQALTDLQCTDIPLQNVEGVILELKEHLPRCDIIYGRFG